MAKINTTTPIMAYKPLAKPDLNVLRKFTLGVLVIIKKLLKKSKNHNKFNK